jgi:hypothetical protein
MGQPRVRRARFKVGARGENALPKGKTAPVSPERAGKGKVQKIKQIAPANREAMFF